MSRKKEHFIAAVVHVDKQFLHGVLWWRAGYQSWFVVVVVKDNTIYITSILVIIFGGTCTT